MLCIVSGAWGGTFCQINKNVFVFLALPLWGLLLWFPATFPMSLHFQVWVLRAVVRGWELPGHLPGVLRLWQSVLRSRGAEGAWRLHEEPAENGWDSGHASGGKGSPLFLNVQTSKIASLQDQFVVFFTEPSRLITTLHSCIKRSVWMCKFDFVDLLAMPVLTLMQTSRLLGWIFVGSPESVESFWIRKTDK